MVEPMQYQAADTHNTRAGQPGNQVHRLNMGSKYKNQNQAVDDRGRSAENRMFVLFMDLVCE